MYEEWTTEVPQYNNSTAQLRGGSVYESSLWNIASCRDSRDSVTVFTFFGVGLRLVLEVGINVWKKIKE